MNVNSAIESTNPFPEGSFLHAWFFEFVEKHSSKKNSCCVKLLKSADSAFARIIRDKIARISKSKNTWRKLVEKLIQVSTATAPITSRVQFLAQSIKNIFTKHVLLAKNLTLISA